ncbi:BnaC03g59560D [Brassica napus]|uniref:BnaC03g59560D protein n=1 Tax=Brassica napus TaxID=3708 RepID=A0A078HBW4_BRANA|nr:BnaC03g59560D [Brassica napus]
MSGELPKRLIKEGEETQVTQINNNCRMCDTSLSRKELVDFEDDGGFWSTVVRRKEGVTILDLWKNHHEAVKKWSNADRIRLVYLCIIVTMVCARDGKANIPFKFGQWKRYQRLESSVEKNWTRFNRLENIFTSEDDIYPYISWSGNYEVVVNAAFCRADEVEDDGIKVLMKMIHTKHDFSDHVLEFEETPEFSWGLHDKQGEDDEVAENDEEAPKNDEEDGSDEDFRTPRGSSNRVSRARKGKKRLPDRGMEKKKQKILSSRPQQAPFKEDMKSFMAQLFEQNFSAMEERLQKQMGERFEKMQYELKGSLKDASVEVDDIEPLTSKPSPSKPSPIKPSPSKPSQYVEKFAAMISRIVKAVAPPESKKQLLLSPYSIVDVPMKSRLNKSCADCLYALKHLECLLHCLDLSLVDDEIMQGCRQKIALDIWEAAHDPMLIQLMAEHVPSEYEISDVFDIEKN